MARLREPVKEITWQLVRGREFSSRVIGYFGAGFYSHIDVVTPTGYLRGARSDVIRGIPAGVQDRPQNYESWRHVTRFTLPVNHVEYDRFWEYSDKQLQKPYDSYGLVRSFVFSRNWRDDDSWWCSELQAMNGEAAGFWTIAPHVQNVSPGDCAFLFAGCRAKRTEIPCQ